jgi:hypothetical protein
MPRTVPRGTSGGVGAPANTFGQARSGKPAVRAGPAWPCLRQGPSQATACGREGCATVSRGRALQPSRRGPASHRTRQPICRPSQDDGLSAARRAQCRHDGTTARSLRPVMNVPHKPQRTTHALAMPDRRAALSARAGSQLCCWPAPRRPTGTHGIGRQPGNRPTSQLHGTASWAPALQHPSARGDGRLATLKSHPPSR